ncbi:MAG: tRNA (cytidine(34)-2'-O)-methyltransferase [Deltaproteobacteria bacterium]|nr:tRNA (cytidine(34)-2'-O)-methyltransferase [Deltaproteobacteria bacterium]
MSESISRARKKIADPALHIILYEPEIPANTGNIARLCAAAELPLHLIHPLGFKTDDRHLKRAGLDYWSEVEVHEHENFAAFETCWRNLVPAAPIIALSARTETPYSRSGEDLVRRGLGLLFGPETRGLPREITCRFPTFTIPMTGRVRSLNLSTAVGIVAYHFLERLEIF